MPLTAKGEKIMAAMKEKHGSERGEEIFYRAKNAGTIEGVDAEEVERSGDGLREQLRAAQESASSARTEAARASYRAECDRLSKKIADMEKADMGHHIAGHVGKADTPLSRAEAEADAKSANTETTGIPPKKPRIPPTAPEDPPEKSWVETLKKRGDANVEIRKMSDGRWGVIAHSAADASKAAGQDSPLEKLEAEIDEMKLHNKIGDALVKHCDMLKQRLDTFEGYARTGENDARGDEGKVVPREFTPGPGKTPPPHWPRGKPND